MITMTFHLPAGQTAHGTAWMSVTTKKSLGVMSRPVKSVKRSRAGMMLVMTVPSWVPEPETTPAPLPLLLWQWFVTTWAGDYGSDLLLAPAPARDWLTKPGLWNADRPPTLAELDLARHVRENIRAMLVANRGGSPPAPADLQAIQAITHD